MGKFYEWVRNTKLNEDAQPLPAPPEGSPPARNPPANAQASVEESQLPNQVKSWLDHIFSKIPGMNKQKKMTILQAIIQMIGQEEDISMSNIKAGERTAHKTFGIPDQGVTPSGPPDPGDSSRFGNA